VDPEPSFQKTVPLADNVAVPRRMTTYTREHEGHASRRLGMETPYFAPTKANKKRQVPTAEQLGSMAVPEVSFCIGGIRETS